MHKFPEHANLTLTQLRCVLEVADRRGFIHAAYGLGLSQPALTRTVKRVEKLLGVKLFTRTTRRLTVTPAGQEFASLARRLLNDLRIGIEGVRKLEADELGQVVLSSVMPLHTAELAWLVLDYRRNSPGVEVHLRQGLQTQVVDDVRTGAVDFGIGYIDELPPSMTTEELRREHYYVVCHKSSALRDQRSIPLRDLKDATFVSFPPESHTRRMVDSAARSLGFSLNYVVTTNQRAGLLELVRHGAGIAIVPRSDCPDPQDENLLVRQLVHKRLSSRLGFIYLRERPLPEPAWRFKAWFKEWLHEQEEEQEV